MSKTKPYVFVGGGLASASGIQALIEQKVPGSDILLISREPEVPYNRPPLSKKYLVGKKARSDVFVEPISYYTEHGIELLLETSVVSLDTAARTLETDTKNAIKFEKLLIATGGRPRILDIPGKDLQGIYYLRTLQDCDAIKKAATPGKKVVVIGAGFIGVEVASSLQSLGCEVTVVHNGERLFDRFALPSMSAFIHTAAEKHGVTMRYNDAAAMFVDGSGAVRGVRTQQGQEIPADIVVVGIGVELALDFCAGTELLGNNMIPVDEYLETTVPGIFAAGDVAEYPDQIFGGKRRRIEHWDHAQASGRAAGLNMIGKKLPFEHLSYFFSDLFDLSFELWGDTDTPDDSVFAASPDGTSAACWYLRDGTVSAYFAINQPDKDKEAAQLLITKQTPVTKDQLQKNH